MTKLGWVKGWVLAMGLAACGPSAGQVKEAREASYRVPADTAFELAIEATRSLHKIQSADPSVRQWTTLPRWYSYEGQAYSAGAGDEVKVSDRAVLVGFAVMLMGDTNAVRVVVETHAEMLIIGQVNHEPLPVGDPRRPGWVDGKADALVLKIHEALKDYAVAPAAPAPTAP